MSQPSRRSSIMPIVMLLLLILVSSVGIFAYATIKPLVAVTGQTVPRRVLPPTPLPGTPQPSGLATTASTSAGRAGTGTASAAVLAAPTVTLPSLQRKERVNFLLLGSDTDLKFATGTYLTQSMIVVTVDPVSHTVGMLSIPRDLWVNIPGLGYGKIQTAYEVGGVDLARATVEQDFGIPIHYYAWVGLQGFIKMIDTVGGIDMDVSHPVLDDAYPDDLNPSDPYAYMRLYIPAGPQHLDGETALQFVRSRHGDLIGDFGRSGRQQELLLALKQKLTGPTLVTHLPQLAGDLQDTVRTDVPLGDLLAYANFARGLKREEIHQVVLQPPDYSENGTSPDGTQAIVIPNWQAIDQVVAQMFKVSPRPASGARASTDVIRGATPAPAAAQRSTAIPRAVEPTPTRQPVDERPTPPPPTATPQTAIMVQVQNGTSVPGLALRATQYLEDNGYRLLAPSNGPGGVQRTTVTYSQPDARSVAYSVASLMHATVVASNRPTGGSASVVVLLGKDAVTKY